MTDPDLSHWLVAPAEAGLLTKSPSPPPGGAPAAFPPDEPRALDEAAWIARRGRALKPQLVSKLVTTEQHRREFLTGARLLRFQGETARPGFDVKPQQLLVADVLAAGYEKNAILMPRRSSKTLSLYAVGIGRAAHRDDYRVGVLTMTTGKAGRSRFLKDVAGPMEQLYPVRRERPFKVIRIAGMEAIDFSGLGGGSMNWLSTPDDVRGEAFDLLILDEAGEADPDFAAEVMAAANPTQDTRPGAQLVVAGTAGRYREGNALWQALVLARSGVGGALAYHMPESTNDEELADWEPSELNPNARVRELVEVMHPGIGTLTSVDRVRSSFHGMKPEDFAREYGGIFGITGKSVGIVDLDKWHRQGDDGDLPAPPERFAIAFSAHPDQLAASIVAAWRLEPEGKAERGRAVIVVLDHKRGVDWLAKAANQTSKKFKVPLTYDKGSPVAQLAVAQLHRARPIPKLEPYGFMEVKKAAALLIDEIDRENIRHYNQPMLDASARVTVKRAAGANGWALGRLEPASDITPLEAASMALLSYDEAKPAARGPLGRVVT